MNLKLCDCRVSINFYFFGALAVLAWFDRGGMITASVIAASLHECGHLTAMLCIKAQRPTEVRLTPFGMNIKSSPTAEFYKGRAVVILSGSMTNLVLSVLTFCFAPQFAAINFIMGAINLMPVEALDGGELLSILLERICSEKAASFAVTIISIIILMITSFIGVRILFITKYNFSLLAMSLWMLTSMVIRWFKQNEAVAKRKKRAAAAKILISREIIS